MNWILLLIAGLFEAGFATCLGKAKETRVQQQRFGMPDFYAAWR